MVAERRPYGSHFTNISATNSEHQQLRMEGAVFWLAAAGAGCYWLPAVLLPKAAITQRMWRSELAALPFAAVFIALVLPRLPWWVQLFVNADLSLTQLTAEFALPESFLLLWLYVLCFDVAVYRDMFEKLLLADRSSLEISLWAAVTAICAPLGYACFTLVYVSSSAYRPKID